MGVVDLSRARAPHMQVYLTHTEPLTAPSPFSLFLSLFPSMSLSIFSSHLHAKGLYADCLFYPLLSRALSNFNFLSAPVWPSASYPRALAFLTCISLPRVLSFPPSLFLAPILLYASFSAEREHARALSLQPARRIVSR